MNRSVFAAAAALILAGCGGKAHPDFYQRIDFRANGNAGRADVYGGGDRSALGFFIDPIDVDLAGEAMGSEHYQIDISSLHDVDPGVYEIQQMSICDPRISLDFMRGGDHFLVQPVDATTVTCHFTRDGVDAGTIEGVLAFQTMHPDRTDFIGQLRVTFTQPTEPDPGVENVLDIGDVAFHFDPPAS